MYVCVPATLDDPNPSHTYNWLLSTAEIYSTAAGKNQYCDSFKGLSTVQV